MNLSIFEYNIATKQIVGDAIYQEEQTGNPNQNTLFGGYLTKSILATLPDNKESETIDYAEEDGYRISVNPSRVSTEYAFTLTFIVGKENTENLINQKIVSLQSAFNGKCLAVFNHYRKQLMIGYIVKAVEIEMAEKVEVYSNYRDMVNATFTLEINDPSLCNYQNDSLS